MQTLKIKYSVTDEESLLIKQYQEQYSHTLRFAYNRAKENCTDKYIEPLTKQINNINLMDSFFIRSAVKESIVMVKTGQDKIIFGGKKNFIDRCQGKISKDDFLKKRLSPIYSMGEANQKGNRKFQINEDGNSFIFKPSKSTHINLNIASGYRRYKKILLTLYKLQELRELPISYKLNGEYIYISFDETKLNKPREFKKIENRIFAVDLNPNYVGWSVVDWKTSSEFKVVKSGVISIKEINDKEFKLKKSKKNPNGYSSEHPKRIYLNNKRTYEVFQISKHLVNIAKHYQCSLFSMEDLSIESSDKSKGRKYNSLCNKMWNRDKLVLNIQKRCNIIGLQLLKVPSNFSSFIGNFLFRDLGLPDMVLASIEIGRRGYEFNNQYILKKKEIKKNIVQPLIEDFVDRYAKSLEEFGIEGEVRSFSDLYYHFFKNSKRRYRVSLENLNLKFYRCFSRASLIMQNV